MLDSGCCAPPGDAVPPLCDGDKEEAEEKEAPEGPLGVLVDEASRPPERSGWVSVRTSSSSSLPLPAACRVHSLFILYVFLKVREIELETDDADIFPPTSKVFYIGHLFLLDVKLDNAV